jgi:hypothetical protein
MNAQLEKVLEEIGEIYKDDILDGGRHYLEVDIGRKAGEMGFEGLQERYGKVQAIVPLRGPAQGMKVRIDGRTFTNYAKFSDGVVVPEYVARAAGRSYDPFRPNDSMILNFH